MGSKRSSGAGPSVTLRKRLAQIEACEKSGESLKVYAERHGLSVHTLYQAKKVARRQGLIPPYRIQHAARAAKPSKARPARFVQAVRKVSPLNRASHGGSGLPVAKCSKAVPH